MILHKANFLNSPEIQVHLIGNETLHDTKGTNNK